MAVIPATIKKKIILIMPIPNLKNNQARKIINKIESIFSTSNFYERHYTLNCLRIGKEKEDIFMSSHQFNFSSYVLCFLRLDNRLKHWHNVLK